MDPASLVSESLVVDVHVHGRHLVPAPLWAAYRRAVGASMPPDLPLDVLAEAGVDAVVAKAVGDRIVTRFHPTTRWRAVRRQLDSLRHQSAAAGADIVLDTGDLARARARGRPAVFLGVEGADILAGRLARLEALHQAGVRVLGLVHYADNSLGSVCLPWQDWLPVPVPARRHRPGLTAFGGQVIDRCAELSILVDLAHADRPTCLAACQRSRRPLVSSHTGARALQDFRRYLSDEEALAVAATGGLVGLWPFRFGEDGMADVADFSRHAAYLAELIGPEHLCIGTDMNGVTGLMDGYAGEHQFAVLAGALLRAGFSERDAAGALGGNALRVMEVVGLSRPANGAG